MEVGRGGERSRGRGGMTDRVERGLGRRRGMGGVGGRGGRGRGGRS